MNIIKEPIQKYNKDVKFKCENISCMTEFEANSDEYECTKRNYVKFHGCFSNIIQPSWEILMKCPNCQLYCKSIIETDEKSFKCDIFFNHF